MYHDKSLPSPQEEIRNSKGNLHPRINIWQNFSSITLKPKQLALFEKVSQGCALLL